MATKEEFKELAQKLADQFQLKSEVLHELVFSLKVPANNSEVLRLVFIENDNTIGVCFQVEIIPTDAIQIFSVCENYLKGIRLLECFYVSVSGENFSGFQASAMLRQDLETAYIKALESRTKIQQQEEFELRKLEKSGKVTFH